MECPQCRQQCPCLYNRKMIEELVVTRIERMMCKECAVGVDTGREIPERIRHEVIYWVAFPPGEGEQRFRERTQAMFGDNMVALATSDAAVREQLVQWFSGRCKTYRGLKNLVQLLAAKLATQSRVQQRLEAAKQLAPPRPAAPLPHAPLPDAKTEATTPSQPLRAPKPSKEPHRRSGLFALCAVILFVLLIAQQCLKSVLARRPGASTQAERSSRAAPLPSTLPQLRTPLGAQFQWTPGPDRFWNNWGRPASGSKGHLRAVSGSSSTR